MRNLGYIWVAIVALGCTGAALAGVDLRIGNGDKVTGTLNPAGEVEVLRVFLPEGASLSVSAKGKKAKGRAAVAAVSISVRDAADAELTSTATGKSAKVKNLVVPATAEYRILVRGDGVTVGDYEAVVKWKDPKSAALDGDVTLGDATLQFAAGAAASATFKAKAAKGSLAQPQIYRVSKIATAGDVALPAPPPPAKSHTVKKLLLPETDDYTVHVRDVGGQGGAVQVTAKLKQAKGTKRKLSVTADDVGANPGGGDVAIGALLGTAGGTFTLDSTDAGEVKGAGIDVPAGALSGVTLLVIGTSPAVPPTDASLAGSGASVFFGPSGQTFAQDVTVTIPFDVGPFAGDFSTLRIVQREADGTLSVVDPQTYVINAAQGTVSFPTRHFTSFRAFAPSGGPLPPLPSRQDLNGDGIDDLVVPAPNAGFATGRVYVFFGGQSLTSRSSGAADVTIEGASQGDLLGVEVAAGDVNGDTRADLLVTTEAGDGAVLVFFGGSSQFGPTGPQDADVTISGQSGQGGFHDIATGDVGGDSTPDVVLGSEGAANGVGAVYVFLGGPQLASTDTSNAAATFTGEQVGDLFGATVSVGDVIGDGRAEIVVGADMVDNPGRTGAVYAFDVSAGLTGRSGSSADVILRGGIVDGGFGLPVVLGDFNADGKRDIAAAEGFDAPQPGAGVVYIFFGGALTNGTTANASATIVGEPNGFLFGVDLESADLDRDGDDELLASTFARDVSSINQGATYVFNGATGFASRNASAADFIIDGESPGEFHVGILPPVDVLAQRLLQIVTVAPFNQAGGQNAGRVYVNANPPAASAANAPVKITGQADEFLGFEFGEF